MLTHLPLWCCSGSTWWQERLPAHCCRKHSCCTTSWPAAQGLHVGKVALWRWWTGWSSPPLPSDSPPWPSAEHRTLKHQFEDMKGEAGHNFMEVWSALMVKVVIWFSVSANLRWKVEFSNCKCCLYPPCEGMCCFVKTKLSWLLLCSVGIRSFCAMPALLCKQENSALSVYKLI